MDIQGKAAIVTGAGTGVGRALALQLARGGCSVLLNYCHSKDGAENAASEARELGVKAIAHQADVSQDDACREMVATATRELGRLDILVNNAGTTKFIPHAELESVTEADWDEILSVNLKGPFYCSRAAKAAMQASGGGDIVMTSSVAGLIGQGSSIPYCASKAALNNLVITLARIMGPQIRVNAVAPGFIDGAWLQEGLGSSYDTIKSMVEGRSPLDRVVTPEDVADAILSIIGGSDLVTGHVLPIEAGMLIGQ
jgi:3-oxoacyl-[acyl-carrier protein] reductase